MTKREEKSESCSRESCGCCNWWGKILGVSLSALWLIISIVTCLIACGALICAQKSYEVSQASYDFNVLSAGWEENFNRMSKVYESEAYISYASDNASQAESYFGLAWDEATATDEDIDEEDTYGEDDYEEDANITAWGDDIKTIVEDMLASTPVRWDKDARFTIVEYTELLCPFCQRHSSEGTINSVMEQFPGEVNSVSRHFIIHGETALQLASAMECIAELNPDAYNQAFEKAFEAYPVDMDTLVSIATELGTDASALQTCVDEWRYTQAVNDGMNQASKLFGVNWTPGNVIIDRETGNYRLVSGAYPVDEFVTVINEMKNA